jgi:hypothetical protein
MVAMNLTGTKCRPKYRCNWKLDTKHLREGVMVYAFSKTGMAKLDRVYLRKVGAYVIIGIDRSKSNVKIRRGNKMKAVLADKLKGASAMKDAGNAN